MFMLTVVYISSDYSLEPLHIRTARTGGVYVQRLQVRRLC